MYIFLIFILNFYYTFGQNSTLLDRKDCTCNYKIEKIGAKIILLPPWQVTLIINSGNQSEELCGAIILNKKWLATSSQCFLNFDFRLGEIFISLNRELYVYYFASTRQYTVSKILTEDQYSKEEFDPNYYFYAVALLQIVEEFEFTDDIRSLKPACLYDADFRKTYLKENLFMFGLGKNTESTFYQDSKKEYFDKPGSELNEIFYRIKNFTGDELLYEVYEQRVPLITFCETKTIFCANSEDSTCYSDEGNPLNYQVNETTFYVVAMNILSYPLVKKINDDGCILYSRCKKKRPGFFLRIENVINMMNLFVGVDSYCTINSTYNLFEPQRALREDNDIDHFCDCSSKNFYLYKSLRITEKSGLPILAQNHDFGWIVPIITTYDNSNRIVCTGVLLNEKFVLTVASCLDINKKGPLVVYFGPNNFEIISQIEDYDKNYFSNIKNVFFHPNYNKSINENEIALILLKKFINLKTMTHLKFACIPREDELPDYILDFLVSVNFIMDIPGFSLEKTNKDNLYLMYHTIKGNEFYFNDTQCFKDSLTCIRTAEGVKLGYEGGVLHRLVRNTVEVLGLYITNYELNNKFNKKVSYFINIVPRLNWIHRMIGGYKQICTKNEANKVINVDFCKCDYSLDKINEPMPWSVSIYNLIKSLSKYYLRVVCRGTILNEYWILTTAECQQAYNYEKLFVSKVEIKKEKFTENEMKILKKNMIPIDYSILHPQYYFSKKEANVALLKLENFLFKDTKTFAPACIYRSFSERNYIDDLVLSETSEKKIVLWLNQQPDEKKNFQCKIEELTCFKTIPQQYCAIDDGTPVIRVIGKKSVVYGYSMKLDYMDYTDYKSCYNVTDFIVSQISKKINWINSVLNEQSYCLIESDSLLDQTKNLCKCQSNNNQVAISKVISGSKLRNICRGLILNEYWILSSGDCFESIIDKSDVAIITDRSKFFEDLINISDLKNEPLKISRYMYKIEELPSYNLVLIRLKKKIQLGIKTDFWPACFSYKYIYFESYFNDSFAFLPSHKGESSTWYVYERINNKCDFDRVFCVYTPHVICDKDQGTPIKKYILDDSKKKILTIGILMYFSEFNDEFNVMYNIRYDKNWITDEVGIHRMCHVYSDKRQVRVCDCRLKQSLSSRILNGTKASPKPLFTFMASIFILEEKLFENIELSFIGSGVLITTNWVLTSKNLLKPFLNKTSVYICLGPETFNVVDAEILSKHFHEVSKISVREDNVDLALIRIKNPIKLGINSSVFVPCISKEPIEDFQNGYLVGIGFGIEKPVNRTKFDVRKLLKQEKKLNMLIFNEYSNQSEMIKNYPSMCNENKICLIDSGSICYGDQGGPLIYIYDDIIQLYGIVYTSSAYYRNDVTIPCGENIISSYTKISPFYGWINQVIGDEDFCHS